MIPFCDATAPTNLHRKGNESAQCPIDGHREQAGWTYA
jgi:hypothetical protein